MKSPITFFLIINLFYIILTKFPDNHMNYEGKDSIFKAKYLKFNILNEDKERLYYKKGKYKAFPNTIRINKNGKLFMSVPRHLFGEEIDSTIPGTINTVEGDQLTPWPNEEENDFITGTIHSVVGFEIDLDGNLYLLNHNNSKRELLKYDEDGHFIDKIDLTSVTTKRNPNSFLSNIVLDLTYKYAYISDTGRFLDKDFEENEERNKTESCLITVNLKKKYAFTSLERHHSTKPDLEFKGEDKKIKNIGLYGLALSCDKRFLYYSPVKSQKLYEILTFKLQDERVVRAEDVKEYNKVVSGFEMTSSARGLFYYTSIQDNSVNVHFSERPFNFIDNKRKILHDFRGDYNDLYNLTEFPTSLTFSGTTGNLYYLINKYNIFTDNNIDKNLNIQEDNFIIFKDQINDRSYLYPCNPYYYLQSSLWFIIIILSLLFSFLIIYIIKSLAKLTVKEKNIEEKNNIELINME